MFAKGTTRQALSGNLCAGIAGEVSFEGRLQGQLRQALEDAWGDGIVRHADGLFAYPLAVVVDDEAQGITDIVRGADLLDATYVERYLQRALGLSQQRYLHVPVVVDACGDAAVS